MIELVKVNGVERAKASADATAQNEPLAAASLGRDGSKRQA